jgi:cytochrome c6
MDCRAAHDCVERGKAIRYGSFSTVALRRTQGMIALVVTLFLTLAVFVGPAAAAGDATAGAKIFAARCARCHGKDGQGNGPDLAKLHPTSSPVNWTRSVVMKKWSDKEIVDIITKGGKAVDSSPVMPPFGGKLSDAQIQDMLAFIRTLAK